MVVLKQLTSILSLNGMKLPVRNFIEWGGLVLSGSELTAFKNDVDEITADYNNLLKEGRVNFTVENKTITTPLGLVTEVPISITHEFEDDSLRHPKAIFWESKFAEDPRVAYNPPVLIRQE
jgi:hypothetical protein